MAHILLAEDDSSLRGFLSEALRRAGHMVTDAEDGVTALHILRRGMFDLLLTDIVMPEMDGIELASHAAELAPDMPVIFITGFAAVELDRSPPETRTIITKPFHLKDVVAEVEKRLMLP